MSQQHDDDHAQPCLKCEYDLRATALTGTCPECGTPVVETKLGYRVDGDCLVIHPNARLPERCMLSDDEHFKPGKPGVREGLRRVRQMPIGQPIELRIRNERSFASDVMLSAAIIVVCVLLQLFARGEAVLAISWFTICAAIALIGFVDRLRGKPCKIKVYLSYAGQWRRDGECIAAYVLPFIIAIVWFGTIDGLLGRRIDQSIGVLFAFIVAAAVGRLTVHRRGSQFYARKQVNNEYWMVGCSDSYLRYCAEQRQRILAEAGVDEATLHERMAATSATER